MKKQICKCGHLEKHHNKFTPCKKFEPENESPQDTPPVSHSLEIKPGGKPDEAVGDSLSSGTDTLSDKIHNPKDGAYGFIYVLWIKEAIKKLKSELLTKGRRVTREKIKEEIDKIFGEELTG